MTDATSQEGEQAALPLPPYGYMNELYMWDVDTRRVPDTFAVAGLPGTPAQWRAFVERQVHDIAVFLWPRFDRPSQSWQGASTNIAMSLTVADLDLIDKLRPLLLQTVRLDGESLKATHRSMFEDEDENKPGSVPYVTLDAYLHNLPTESVTLVRDTIKKRIGGFGPAPLRFKEHCQRPRPYQVAFMLGRPFRYELARSAVTPALPSGHCMQGIVGRSGAFMAHRLLLEGSVGALAGLQQYMIDYGDRRVMAGAHYPSDNLASWFCSLRLCDHLFSEAGQIAKDFIWAAITTRSAVFDAMGSHVRDDPRSPYAEPLRLLGLEAARPVPRTDS